mmetsp:Transcript_4090/g.18580  ORF Transcript_4090/g.18580 Transcript_4090/m.18580 type:complete len:233 (+) Transcript_4090:2812-3510(+)
MPTATIVIRSFFVGSFSRAAIPVGSINLPSRTAPVKSTSTPSFFQSFCMPFTVLMAGAMFSSTKSHAFMPVAHSEIGSHFVPSDAFTMRVFLVTSKLAPSGSSRRNFIMSFTERPWKRNPATRRVSSFDNIPLSMSRSLDFFSFEAAICTTSEPLFPGALDLDLPRVTNAVVLPVKPAARRVGGERRIGDKALGSFERVDIIVAAMIRLGKQGCFAALAVEPSCAPKSALSR